jgi:hypothetical protein
MSFARFINRLFKKPILNETEKCCDCEYALSISNWSPCYECRGNNKYEKRQAV